MIHTILRTAICLAVLSSLSACQITPVNAWEKSVLAEPTMSPGGIAHYSNINSHVFTSKETIKGGEGVAGGGCGCN